jgi:hypothetical protein
MPGPTVMQEIPSSLRRWFVIHFITDFIFAMPLLFIPEIVMPLFGWREVDPISSRLVGAALLGIGGESLLGRNASREVFLAMLNLKVIWGSAAVLGIALGLSVGAPQSALLFLVIFALFSTVWIYYRIKLR